MSIKTKEEGGSHSSRERGSSSRKEKHREKHCDHHNTSSNSTSNNNSGNNRDNREKKKPRRKCRDIMARILLFILQTLNSLFDRFLEYILELILGPKRVCRPIKKKHEFIMKSATELAKLIREKHLKSHEVVKAYIDRMNDVNTDLNALVDGPFTEALEESKRIDERIQKGQISEDEFCEKPFLGVPFTTKDSTAVKGKLHTLGLLSRRNARALEDAECVRLMKEHGAIIIATTNVPEVNKWMETRNLLVGQTNNPYDLRRSVGGSSGGESSMISACGTAFGIGTDIGGSIRIPSFACGIFGHKATAGIVNTKGCTFRKGTEPSTMVTVGPMTRYAKDLLPLFKILAGPVNSIRLKLDDEVDVTKLKYYYIPSNKEVLANAVSKELQKAMFKVTEHFTELTGEEVKSVTLPGIEKSSKLWRYWMTQEPSDYNVLLGQGIKLNPFMELLKKILGRSDFTMAAIYSLIDAILPAEKEDKMRALTTKCEEALNELLGDDGILFYHSSPRVTPFHYYPLFKFYDFHYFSIFNVLKVPATQVPLGLNENGLPLGIQVIATKNRDRHCLAVAEELEKVFGGWTPPFQVAKDRI